MQIKNNNYHFYPGRIVSAHANFVHFDRKNFAGFKIQIDLDIWIELKALVAADRIFFFSFANVSHIERSIGKRIKKWIRLGGDGIDVNGVIVTTTATTQSKRDTLTGVACCEAVYVVYAGCGNGDVYLYACCAFE